MKSNLELQKAMYENSDVVRATGRSTIFVQTLANRGYLIPASGQQYPGYGQRRLYSGINVCQIAALGALTDFGLPPSEARQVAMYVGRILADEGTVTGDALLRICRSMKTAPPIVRYAEQIARGGSPGASEAPGDYECQIVRNGATVSAHQPAALFLPLGAIIGEVLRNLGVS